MGGARSLVLLAIVGFSLAEPQLGLSFPGGVGVPGGLSSIRSADFNNNLKTIVRGVQAKAEEKLGFPFVDKFQPKGYRTQLSGPGNTIYFVKVDIGRNRPGQSQNDYILLRILEDRSGCACLENLKQSETRFSTINYMDSAYSCNQCSNNGKNSPVPGGLDNTRSADFIVRNIVQQVKNQIGFRLGYETNKLEAVSFREQTVAGTNYFVKIDTGNNNNFIHVFIHEDLSGNICLVELEQFKGRFDQIDYIDGDTNVCRSPQPPQPPIPVPGGLDNTRSANFMVKNLVRQVQTEIGFRLGYETNKLEAVTFREQTVAGTNYFVKIDTGSSNNYIHVFIHEDLSGNVCLMGLEQFKGRFDQINYIDGDTSGCRSQPPQPPINSNEITVNGEVFEVLRDSKFVTWEQARDLCEFKGQKLAEPQRQNILPLARELTRFGLTNYWLGGRGTGNDIRWNVNSGSVIQWSQFSRFNSPGLWRDASHPNDVARGKCLYIKDNAENNNPIGMFNCADITYLTPICQLHVFG